MFSRVRRAEHVKKGLVIAMCLQRPWNEMVNFVILANQFYFRYIIQHHTYFNGENINMSATGHKKKLAGPAVGTHLLERI